MKYISKKFGFTLAEVLVTLGLIGVVSAMTIPTLAYNYRGKVLEQQFRTVYSELKEIGSMINYDKGDVGTFAYNCVYGSANIKCGAQDENGKNIYSGTARWASEVMMRLAGGNSYGDFVDNNSGISEKLKEIYKKGGGPQGPFRFYPRTSAGVICDNGGIWLDSKGRIWTFNGENQFICVDINGTAAPNRINIDTFVFKPLTAKEVAIWVAEDPDPDKNINNYSGQIVPCNLEEIYQKGSSNTTPQGVGYKKGSGSAVDSCPFNEPVENIAPVGKNARGKSVDRSNNYWTDYINYK